MWLLLGYLRVQEVLAILSLAVLALEDEVMV